jgi:hypothetical protein
MPFIMGIESSIFEMALNYFDENDIYLVFIDRNYVELCSRNKRLKVNWEFLKY